MSHPGADPLRADGHAARRPVVLHDRARLARRARAGARAGEEERAPAHRHAHRARSATRVPSPTGSGCRRRTRRARRLRRRRRVPGAAVVAAATRRADALERVRAVRRRSGTARRPFRCPRRRARPGARPRRVRRRGRQACPCTAVGSRRPAAIPRRRSSCLRRTRPRRRRCAARRTRGVHVHAGVRPAALQGAGVFDIVRSSRRGCRLRAADAERCSVGGPRGAGPSSYRDGGAMRRRPSRPPESPPPSPPDELPEAGASALPALRLMSPQAEAASHERRRTPPGTASAGGWSGGTRACVGRFAAGDEEGKGGCEASKKRWGRAGDSRHRSHGLHAHEIHVACRPPRFSHSAWKLATNSGRGPAGEAAARGVTAVSRFAAPKAAPYVRQPRAAGRAGARFSAIRSRATPRSRRRRRRERSRCASRGERWTTRRCRRTHPAESNTPSAAASGLHVELPVDRDLDPHDRARRRPPRARGAPERPS